MSNIGYNVRADCDVPVLDLVRQLNDYPSGPQIRDMIISAASEHVVGALEAGLRKETIRQRLFAYAPVLSPEAQVFLNEVVSLALNRYSLKA